MLKHYDDNNMNIRVVSWRLLFERWTVYSTGYLGSIVHSIYHLYDGKLGWRYLALISSKSVRTTFHCEVIPATLIAIS